MGMGYNENVEHHEFLGLGDKPLTFGEQIAQDLNAVNKVTQPKGMGKTTKMLVTGGVLLLVAFVGFKIYKKIK